MESHKLRSAVRKEIEEGVLTKMSSTTISDSKTPCEALSDDVDCNNIDAKTCKVIDCSDLKSVLMRNFARLLVGEPPRPIPIRSSATTLIFNVIEWQCCQILGYTLTCAQKQPL